ncbi:MAG: metal-sulfur cluster assembly factor [Hymenobacteraceae bacterium]|nr:metal-sulfur cluster assembly factor [Hymenobacteraceae bacterium]MDX5396449.1 metal-sulfur cluster assembly factor [Hymenobacteraceae bacterium]MDX5442569.1 metal-sulfur cluster assembly factor [Hymenobacteraceae bacterium]MDX5512510.1 metal-sulfur cluster assembly factor [Hymenobacteraceae bacterium]
MKSEIEVLQQTDALLKQVIDPEIGLNIVDLGLVYKLSVSEEKEIVVTMTLTTPGCPMSQTITATVTNLLETNLPEYKAKVDLVWFPMWDPEMITEEGQKQLNGIIEFKPKEDTGSIWDRFFN